MMGSKQSRARGGSAAVLACLLAWTAPGCSSSDRAAVEVAAAMGVVTSARIDQVVLEVSEAGSTGGPLVSAPLSLGVEGVWLTSLLHLPAGRYAFTLDASDAAGVLLYSGTTTASLASGETARLSILAQEVLPSSPASSTPVITGVTLPADPVPAGGEATVAVEVAESSGVAAAADATRPGLGFTWGDDCGGAFPEPNLASTRWTAPPVAPASSCQLSIRVVQGESSATLYLPVRVE